VSQLSDYIFENLKSEYEKIRTLKSTDKSKIELYSENGSDNKLVVICSKIRNDHVYRALRGKVHPNIATVYDVSSEEEYVLVLEEYIDGVMLSDKLKNGHLEKKEAVSYMLDLCSALSFLHSLNIIHRDIKPSNIIINKSDVAVLIDYSSARELSYTNDSDTVNLGTPGYAAPEQYGIHQSLPATDIYALGVLFNEMLLGINPIIKTPKGPLGKIIKKCTNSQIGERYQKISSLKRDLNRYRLFHFI